MSMGVSSNDKDIESTQISDIPLLDDYIWWIRAAHMHHTHSIKLSVDDCL